MPITLLNNTAAPRVNQIKSLFAQMREARKIDNNSDNEQDSKAQGVGLITAGQPQDTTEQPPDNSKNHPEPQM